MADSKLTVGELVYKISGDMENLQTELKKAETELKDMKSAMEKTSATAGKMDKAMSTAGKAVKAFVGAFAVKALIDFGKAAVQSASELLEQQTKLAQVLRVSQNATDEQIASMIEYADTLEKVGVIDKEVILASEAQLATYDLSIDSIKTLTPVLLDYLAAEKGANATKEDAIGITNGLAQAIQGNYSSLSRTGFILDDATKQLIEHGTQEERVQAITDVLNSTYKDYNKTLGDTFLGTQKRAQRALGDFKEDLGFALMPTIQLLTKELLNVTGGFESGEPRINKWGKTIYQTTNFIIAMGKAFVLVVKAIVGFVDTLVQGGKVVFNFAKNTIQSVTAIKDNFATLGKGLLKVFKGDFKGALEEFKSNISEKFKDTGDSLDNFRNKTGAWSEILSESFDSVGQSALEAFDATNFKPITAEALTAWKEGQEAVDSFGQASEDTAESSEKLQEKLLGVRETLLKTANDLEGKVTDAFKKFNEAFGESLDDTNNKLTDTVLNAQDKIKDLKEELSNIDSSDSNAGDQRSRINAQIDEQEKILESRKGFEERQAQFITGLREKLTQAGIDAEQEGLSSLLEIKSLEDQIKDERALRDLDDFAREEELQRRRLTLLVENLIAEVTALRDKIEQQKELEADLTSFLISQNALRKKDVETFANAAIAKYGEMANALRNAVSLQQQLNALRSGGGNGGAVPQFAAGGYVDGRGGEVHPGEYVIPANLVQRFAGAVSAIESVRNGSGSSVTNNNVNAPITMNANIQDGVDLREFGREMVWELGRR